MGKTSCLLPILNQDPHHHNCQGPLAVLQGQAVRRVSVYGPSYSSVCLRLLGWGTYNVNI